MAENWFCGVGTQLLLHLLQAIHWNLQQPARSLGNFQDKEKEAHPRKKGRQAPRLRCQATSKPKQYPTYLTTPFVRTTILKEKSRTTQRQEAWRTSATVVQIMVVRNALRRSSHPLPRAQLEKRWEGAKADRDQNWRTVVSGKNLPLFITND